MPKKQSSSIDSASPNERPPNAMTKHSRSRGGCDRCKQRRQKCDEQRPQCSRCRDSGIDSCIYTVNLQWGGREFANYKSNSSIKKFETEPGTFVYVSRLKKKAPMSEEASKRPSRSLSPLDSATRTEKLLLHHFTTSASRITSCHTSIQSSFCHLLLPMAMSYPPLLSALMALSAIHRESLLTSASSPFHQTNEIISLKASSISQLRSGLLMPTNQREMKDVLLATALMLTMCEIHSGADQPRSWRLHLEGAKAILSSSPTTASSNPNQNSQAGLLERWYTSIESLAAISSKGLRAGDLPDTSSLVLPNSTSALESDNDVFLDDYFGFCTDLVPAFREVGALAWERRSISDARMRGEQMLLSEEDLNTEALLLESRIRDMILRDLITPARFYSGVQSSLSPEVLREFYLCNEAYQYAALLHIYRCVMCIDKEDERVQGAVARILECVEAITPREGLSPYIVLTMPLFTAGREAVGDDRERVRRNMKELWERLRLRNVWRSLEILEAGWESGNGKLGKDADEENYDFIPY